MGECEHAVDDVFLEVHQDVGWPRVAAGRECAAAFAAILIAVDPASCAQTPLEGAAIRSAQRLQRLAHGQPQIAHDQTPAGRGQLPPRLKVRPRGGHRLIDGLRRGRNDAGQRLARRWVERDERRRAAVEPAVGAGTDAGVDVLDVETFEERLLVVHGAVLCRATLQNRASICY